jgi:large subunit ribosomal protein L15
MLQGELKPPSGSRRRRKRVGRGNASGHGTYSGRGLKGQKSRSGPGLRVGFEGGQVPLIRRMARKRGFTNRFRIEYSAVNVGRLARFEAGAEVTPQSLREAGVIRNPRQPVKILGQGELGVPLTVRVHKFSASARAKIEAAGGTAQELGNGDSGESTAV